MLSRRGKYRFAAKGTRRAHEQIRQQPYCILLYKILEFLQEFGQHPSFMKNTGHPQEHERQGHILVLTGATFEGSGMNYYILNNAIQWKKMGLRVTVICQDRNAETMAAVDSYIVGDFPADAPRLQDGQMRVVIPDINGIIPIYATHQYCEFPGITSKAVQEMTDQEIETNITMTVKCLRAVCEHDRPFKVIANYMIISGIIAARGLEGLHIPYDIIVPGPALMYSVYPYPHLWKWVLPAFKKATIIFQHSEFVKTQFLKCFKSIIAEYRLNEKVKAISPGMDPTKFQVVEVSPKYEQEFLNKLRTRIPIKAQPAQKTQINRKMTAEQIQQVLAGRSRVNQGNTYEAEIVAKWAPHDSTDQVVLYVGALIENKGMGQLLAVAPKLISHRPTLKFIFCGSGPFREHMHELMAAYEDGDFERAKLIGQAGDFITEVNIENHFIKISKQVRDRIIFGGLFEQELIYRLYPFGTIYCVPSKMQQSCSMGIVEAMCCGLTPLCNDHSWFSEVLGKIDSHYEELGQIIRVERSEFFQRLPDTLVRTLDFIKNNKLSKQQYRNKLREIAVNSFSWKHTATILAEQREYRDDP